MDTNQNKIEKLKRIRKHPSFGVNLNPLLTILKPDTDPPSPLPQPGLTGSIDTSDINALFAIATYPGTKWMIPESYSAFDLAEFTQFVNLKTQQLPSYYTAYEQAVALLNALIQQMGLTQALEYLYTPDPSLPPENWSTVSYWVIQEFLSIFMVSGNFRYYGWVNYPGWMGGPYNDPNHLPYRT